jgi:hypothetical protein
MEELPKARSWLIQILSWLVRASSKVKAPRF